MAFSLPVSLLTLQPLFPVMEADLSGCVIRTAYVRRWTGNKPPNMKISSATGAGLSSIIKSNQLSSRGADSQTEGEDRSRSRMPRSSNDQQCSKFN